MINQMQFFGKIKFSSILACIENCQNIVTSGRKWQPRNPKFACFPMEGLFGVVCPFQQMTTNFVLVCPNVQLSWHRRNHLFDHSILNTGMRMIFNKKAGNLVKKAQNIMKRKENA